MTVEAALVIIAECLVELKMQERLELFSRILWRCIVITFAVMLFWFAAYMIPGNLYCNIQSEFFGISQHECTLVTYCGMGLLKLLMWMFFLVPWIAIRMELLRAKPV